MNSARSRRPLSPPFLLRLCAALLAGAAPALTSSAQMIILWSGVSGDWNEPGNWTGGIVPGAADTAQIGQGTASVTSGVSVGSLQMLGGALAGDAQLTLLSGVSEWLGGNMNRSGTLAVDKEALLLITGTGYRDFRAMILLNQGTMQWAGGELRSGYAGQIVNEALWLDQGDSVINNAYGGTTATFTNAAGGTYKHAGAGTTFFQIPFVNNGLIDAQAGTLALQAGGAFNDGSITTGTDGWTRLAGGTLVAAGTVSLHNFELAGGTLEGTHTLAGDPVWTGSSLNTGTDGSTTTIAPGALFTISGAGYHDFRQRTIVNEGTVQWAGGELRSGYAGQIINEALWLDQGDSVINNAYGGTTATFTNACTGVYQHAGAGTTSFQIPFVNNGLIDAQAGTLSLQAGGAFNDGTTTTGTDGWTRLTGGTLVAAGTVSLHNFELAGGTLEGTHTLAGDPVWTGSSLNTGTAGSTTTIAPCALFTISGAGNHDFRQRTIVNQGTVQWTGGELRSGYAGQVVNEALWLDQGDSVINNAYGGTTATFTNACTGVYQHAGAGTTFFQIPFVNDGLIDAQTGTLTLQAGGAFNDGSTTTGTDGWTRLTGGTLVAAGTVNLHNFELAGGTLEGTHTLAGAPVWTGSSLNTGTDGSTTTIAPCALFTISGAGNHDFRQRTIVNQGTVQWTGGELRSGYAGQIVNEALWLDQGDSVINNAYGGTTASFTNAVGGVYQHAGAGTTFFQIPFVNNGLIDAQAGTLSLQAGGAFNDGSVTTGTDGWTRLAGGTLVAAGTVNLHNFELAGGTLEGTHTLAGAPVWTGSSLNTGTVGSTTTIAPGALFTISGAGNHDFRQRMIVNQGTVQWTGGELRSGSAGQIVNEALWLDQSGSAINNAYGGTTATFTNATGGTYRKSSPDASTIQIPFTNAGEIDVQLGIVSLRSGLVLDPGSILCFSLDGTTRGTQYGAINVTTALSLDGCLAFMVLPGFSPLVDAGDTFTLINAASLNGAFCNIASGERLLSCDGLGSFLVNYGAGSPFGAGSVVLTDFMAVPEPSTLLLLCAGCALLLTGSRRCCGQMPRESGHPARYQRRG